MQRPTFVHSGGGASAVTWENASGARAGAQVPGGVPPKPGRGDLLSAVRQLCRMQVVMLYCPCTP